MHIKGIIETSFVDWDGKIVSTIFLPDCNFRCGFCHNHKLVLDPESFDSISPAHMFRYWTKNKDFLDGVCITGGEPTLHKELPELCRDIKELGLKVKLDTNGTNPEVLRQLIGEKLLDYIAMDIKAPLEEDSYSDLTNVNLNDTFDMIKESIRIIINSGVDYEFRTTVIREKHSKEDIEAIAIALKGVRRYVLQKFQPKEVMDEEYKVYTSYNDEEMEEIAEVVKKYINEVKWRGN